MLRRKTIYEIVFFFVFGTIKKERKRQPIFGAAIKMAGNFLVGFYDTPLLYAVFSMDHC